MLRAVVESSAVVSIGYHAATATLEVEFTGGAIYRYFDVPESEHRALINAESIGTYLNQHIKPQYRYQLVERGGP